MITSGTLHRSELKMIGSFTATLGHLLLMAERAAAASCGLLFTEIQG
jgi:hypothetical protein